MFSVSNTAMGLCPRRPQALKPRAFVQPRFTATRDEILGNLHNTLLTTRLETGEPLTDQQLKQHLKPVHTALATLAAETGKSQNLKPEELQALWQEYTDHPYPTG